MHIIEAMGRTYVSFQEEKVILMHMEEHKEKIFSNPKRYLSKTKYKQNVILSLVVHWKVSLVCSIFSDQLGIKCQEVG